jgi:hypothetical protein
MGTAPEVAQALYWKWYERALAQSRYCRGYARGEKLRMVEDDLFRRLSAPDSSEDLMAGRETEGEGG